jgi:hypothetical protein
VAHRGVELAACADDVGLGSALVGQAEDAADVVERQFLTVVKEHDARFGVIERLHDEAPVAAAAFFHFEGFVDVDGRRVGQLRRLRLGDPHGL